MRTSQLRYRLLELEAAPFSFLPRHHRRTKPLSRPLDSPGRCRHRGHAASSRILKRTHENRPLALPLCRFSPGVVQLPPRPRQLKRISETVTRDTAGRQRYRVNVLTTRISFPREHRQVGRPPRVGTLLQCSGAVPPLLRFKTFLRLLRTPHTQRKSVPDRNLSHHPPRV